PLAQLSDERIEALIGPLYSVLDPGLWGIGGTKLSKVLHRKRPASIALHDQWVQACYVGTRALGCPVPKVKERSWADYMVAVSQAMAADLRDGAKQFEQLQHASRAQPALTDLRLLDILAWRTGQSAIPSSEEGAPAQPGVPS